MDGALPKNTLELLFDYIHQNQKDIISRILLDARTEYTGYATKLNSEEKRKVSYIQSLLDYCEAERWMQARNLLEPAEQEYYRYFYRNIQSAKNRTNEGSRSQRDRKLSRPPKQNRRRGVETDMSDLRTPQRIAEKFSELFKNEWCDAMEELEQFKIFEPNAASCLLRIVLDAYRVCTMEADSQIAKLEDAAASILMEGVNRMVGKQHGNKSCLIEYRRGLANICVERLQETFIRRYLPEIIRTVGVYQNLRTHGAVLRYTNQCVTICWAMAVLDPQVYMVDDRDSGRGLLNTELYNTFTKEGPSLWYYVWPPLKVQKGGLILVKGAAQGR
ncbi:hypothetical protein MAR_022341 [Mya arenaria]|uniref:Mitochondria-eating protein C-terminal domain-containing protein n=1 Tax=Mya arenaria TaxID=6604 RepID=A0ABY7DLA2_MYAAR|nr:hypothetical protein MAR_022341 [Mya arenaria]